MCGPREPVRDPHLLAVDAETASKFKREVVQHAIMYWPAHDAVGVHRVVVAAVAVGFHLGDVESDAATVAEAYACCIEVCRTDGASPDEYDGANVCHKNGFDGAKLHVYSVTGTQH